MMNIDIEKSAYAKKAKQLFLEGFNCSQAVFLAFSDKFDMDYETAMKLSSSFGGGIGRLREVCGAASGMLYGYDKPNDYEAKKTHYARIQELAKYYEESNGSGSIVCRDILGISGRDNPAPEKRSSEYYKKRPCPELVATAAAIMEQYIAEHPII